MCLGHQHVVARASREVPFWAVPSLQWPPVRQMLADDDPSAALCATLWPWVAPAALSWGWGEGRVANVHPASRTCLPCISLSEILRVSFCPFHICPGLSGLFFESIKQLLSVPLMWVVNRDSLKVSPDRAMCREALRSSGKAGRSRGLGEGLGPRGQQPGTEGKGPEQHGDSAP